MTPERQLSPAAGEPPRKGVASASGSPHDLAVGARVVSELHRFREDGSLDPEPSFRGTVVDLRPPSFGLPAGVAVVRLDEDGQLADVDVTALVHEDGRPASPIPFWREPEWEVPPTPRTVVNAVERQMRSGEDAEERLRWARLLARCRRGDRGLARVLRDLRRQGAALEGGGADVRLTAGRMDAGAYAAIRQRELAPRRALLAALLRHLGEE